MFTGDSYSNEEQEAAGDLWSKTKNIYVWESKSHNKCHKPKLTKSNQDLFIKG